MAGSITKLSSKGSVILPKKIREQLSLQAGSQFYVYISGDTVHLKQIEEAASVRKVLDRANAAAKSSGLTPDNIDRAIKYVRNKKKLAKK